MTGACVLGLLGGGRLNNGMAEAKTDWEDSDLVSRADFEMISEILRI